MAAPQNLKAVRAVDGEVQLTWSPVEAEEEAVTYNVYRQIDEGEWIQIETENPSSTFTDTDAYAVLGTLQYRVSAVTEAGRESELSEPVSVQDLSNMAGMIDDQDSRVSYTGGWFNWNESSENYAGTVKVLQGAINGTETAELTFVGTGIEIFGTIHYDRGMIEVSIDGEPVETVDTYAPSIQRFVKIYSKDDLEYGVHTITLRATGEYNPASIGPKLELDAFNVLDTTAVAAEEIQVSSVSGLTLVSKANSQMQMKAEVLPADAANQAVTWTVATKEGAAAGIIDENGLLTLNDRNGVVTVTASLQSNPTITGSVDITAALTGAMDSYIVEDSTDNSTPNPAITWDGSWSTWAGEADRHHGGTKTECSTVGSGFSFAFSGTGIQVHSHTHRNFASFDVTLDGVQMGNISLNDTAQNGTDQALIFEAMNLEMKEHTITFTIVERDGKVQTNLDYIEVFQPAEGSVDKDILQTAIETYAGLEEKYYTPETWAPFIEAMDQAVAAMNSTETTEEQVSGLAAALTAAGEALEEADLPAPVIPQDAELTVTGVESTTLVLLWDAAENAESYEVTVWDAGEALYTEQTSDTWLRISGLTPGSAYSFTVKALNRQGEASEGALTAEMTTLPAADTEAPGQVQGIQVVKVPGTAQVKVSWETSEDPQGSAVTYLVYMNGVKVSETDVPEYILNSVQEGEVYNIRIVAQDAERNKSLASIFHFTAEDVRGMVITAVNPLEKIQVKNGTLFENLSLPESVSVTLGQARLGMELQVNWEEGSYNENQAGSQTIYGELQLVEGIENPNGLKAEIVVEVEPKQTVSPTPEPTDTPEPTATPEPTKDPGTTATPTQTPGSTDKPSGDNGQSGTTVTPKPGGSGDKTGSVNTGDPTQTAVWTVLLAGAGAGIVLLNRRRKVK